MQPAPQKHSETVYRKTSPATAATSFAERARGYAPAIMPLIVGFLLLLAVILVLGLVSANEMTEVASNARIKTQRYSERLKRLLQVRLSFVKLESEARVRDISETSRQITPPLQIRLDEARAEASKALEDIGPPPPPLTLPKFKGTPEEWNQRWEQLKHNLQAFIELTKDVRKYSQDGFYMFKEIQNDLNMFIDGAQEAYNAVAKEMEAAL